MPDQEGILRKNLPARVTKRPARKPETPGDIPIHTLHQLLPGLGNRGILARLALLALLGILFPLLWWWESSFVIRGGLALLILFGGYVIQAQLRQLWATQRAYSLAMAAAHDGFWSWDPVSKRLDVGKRLLEILGYRDNFLPDTHAWLELVHPEDRSHYNRTVAEHLKGRTPYFYCEYRVRASSGQYRWIASRGIAVRDRHGVAYQMAGSVTDITERKQHDEELAFMAQHDPLTGLPNRLLLAEKLGEALHQATTRQEHVALLFIDLDRFKDINDSLGHRLGDSLLQDVAGRLRGGLGPLDTLVRQGGDEFIVLLTGIASGATAEARARDFLERLNQPFVTDGNQLHVGASIGLSLYPDDAADAEQLLRDADTAMYVAKRHGGGQVARHTPEMKERVLQRASIELRLHQAIEQQAFSLHYQPKFDTASGRLLGAEALLRWQDNGQWIPPDRFISVAEETGLIIPIGHWVLTEAIACLARWNRLSPTPLHMAINLSARQFWPGDLTETVAALCAEHGVACGQIELEITESMLLQAEGNHVDMLHAMRARGFRLALDDFGTGYSSLSYLHRLPFSSLKIDRSFVTALIDDAGDYAGGSALVPAIITMAHNLGLEVVAEGVETAAQLVLLRDLHCDIHQGYLSGRPMPEADFCQRFLNAPGSPAGQC
ncbi:putative bifunctional diguanylate cyclase/phosphodiesterase [Dechloromonas sp.]|uniref:putative bifunctional diguanylate cyclase/phosphodiesterase n=1 Tax=Dechloromonas sp. TaxID=1917218 RepID=UPI00286E85EC|nr:EAL domain-containing protein [Dechloromonas sp.]